MRTAPGRSRAARIGPLVVLLWLLSATAAAGPHGVKALFREGNRLYEKKDYAGALGKFEQAYERKSDPRILLNIGLTKEKLDRMPEAAVDYERFLRAASGGRYPKRAKAVRSMLQRLRKKLASVSLSCPVRGAAVLVGASSRGTTPLPFPLYLKPGTYTLTVEKAGHKAFQQQLTLAADQHEKLNVPLPAAPLPEPVKKPPAPKKVVLKPLPLVPKPLPLVPKPQPPSRSKPLYKRWWFWTAVGVVVAGSAAAVVATQTGGDARLPGGELGRYTLD